MAAKKQYKVTLESGKVIFLKQMNIKLKNLAVDAASVRTGENASPMAFQSALSDEMIKILIVSINNKKLTPENMEDLDTILEFSEYMTLQKIVQEVAGIDGLKKPKVELVMSS